MATIDAFFKLMNEQGASDLHLVSGQQPALRIRGEIERIKYDTLTNDGLKAMLYEITPEHKIKTFEELGDVDFAYEIPGLARYRANFFMQKYGCAAVFREIPSKVLTAQQLGLPQVITKLASLPRGLVLVTGPTGSGKSTTLAAIIDEANRTRKDHIITIEDPIEFVHQHKKCVVNQRELNSDTRSFKSALKSVLREDPDKVLVGEMRDLETIEAALTIAETGHLTFATLHTNSAVQTINRIIDVFPPHQQPQVRAQLSFTLEGVMCQMLLPRANGQGRVLVLEIMIPNAAIRNLIREDKLHQVYSMMQAGKERSGMQTMNESLLQHYLRRSITMEQALSASTMPEELTQMIHRTQGQAARR